MAINKARLNSEPVRYRLVLIALSNSERMGGSRGGGGGGTGSPDPPPEKSQKYGVS